MLRDEGEHLNTTTSKKKSVKTSRRYAFRTTSSVLLGMIEKTRFYSYCMVRTENERSKDFAAIYDCLLDKGLRSTRCSFTGKLRQHLLSGCQIVYIMRSRCNATMLSEAITVKTEVHIFRNLLQETLFLHFQFSYLQN